MMVWRALICPHLPVLCVFDASCVHKVCGPTA
jgi:hypothetical protein